MADLVDSDKKLLDDEEIVQKAAMNIRSHYSYDQIIKSIREELKQEGTQFIREGNTLFIVHYDQDRVGTFRALNADTALNYINSSWLFVKACYDMGYDVLITEFYDPTIANIFDIISKNPPYPDMGYNIKQSADGWIGTIKLGPDRMGGTV
jgi:hypothetical protein